MLVAAVAHGSGLVLGRTASDSAGGEMPGARRLIGDLDVAGRVLTLDAPHGCPRTARRIIEAGGDCVMPVKGNRPDLPNDLRAFDAAFDGAPTCRTLDKGHGRIDERDCALDGCGPGTAPLPGRRQAFRITRRRTAVKSGRTGGETACGLTSLPPERAGPAEALALNRGHWEIETRLHHVRDVACDEDRSRVRCGRLPRNLACLSNAAISIVRLRGRFNGRPQARRHYAARQREALREALAVHWPGPRGHRAPRRGPRRKPVPQAAQNHPRGEPEAVRRPRRPHPRLAGKTQGHRPSSPGRQQGDFEMAFAGSGHFGTFRLPDQAASSIPTRHSFGVRQSSAQCGRR